MTLKTSVATPSAITMRAWRRHTIGELSGTPASRIVSQDVCAVAEEHVLSVAHDPSRNTRKSRRRRLLRDAGERMAEAVVRADKPRLASAFALYASQIADEAGERRWTQMSQVTGDRAVRSSRRRGAPFRATPSRDVSLRRQMEPIRTCQQLSAYDVQRERPNETGPVMARKSPENCPTIPKTP